MERLLGNPAVCMRSVHVEPPHRYCNRAVGHGLARCHGIRGTCANKPSHRRPAHRELRHDCAVRKHEIDAMGECRAWPVVDRVTIRTPVSGARHQPHRGRHQWVIIDQRDEKRTIGRRLDPRVERPARFEQVRPILRHLCGLETYPVQFETRHAASETTMAVLLQLEESVSHRSQDGRLVTTTSKAVIHP